MNRLQFFTAVWAHSKIEEKIEGFCVCPLTLYTASSPWAQQCGTYTTNAEPPLSHHCQSKLTLAFGFTLYAAQSMSFDKHVITCIHHYNTLLSSFSGQKSLCSAYSSPLPLKPLELLVFLPCPHSCLFQDVICLISLSM